MWLGFLRSVALYMCINSCLKHRIYFLPVIIFSFCYESLWQVLAFAFPLSLVTGPESTVHWSWFGPKHILNNTLSVLLSVSWLLCQFLWSWGGNTGRRRCQTRRRRRTSPPSWLRRDTGRSWRRRWAEGRSLESFTKPFKMKIGCQISFFPLRGYSTSIWLSSVCLA